ncbi:MAG: hypothetical protein N4A62_05110 [Marinisporobacter sp.]|jgi:Co/Zn/Cd efflux system component|nr:hypothetical protein [Marinisporobacter sp.]
MLNENKLSFKAIFIGLLVDYIGSIVLGTLQFFVVMASSWKQGVNITETLLSLKMLSISFFLGIICSILGGYVAAKISKHNEIKHALFVGILSDGISIVMNIIGTIAIPFWYSVSSIILVVPAAIFGGYLGRKSNQSKSLKLKKQIQ